MVKLILHSGSARETKTWGRRLASLLQGGELLAFSGELGAGKTCFIKGLARGLNLPEEEVLSPTFTMVQEHSGRLPLFHIDLYRLDRATLDDLGLREYLFSPGVAAVEWFERLDEAPELDCLTVEIFYEGAQRRRIELSARDEPYTHLLESFRLKFT